MRREQQAALVADYLARGGVIHHIGPSKPTVPNDVLNYLQDLDLDIRAVSVVAGNTIYYVFKGKRIVLKELVALANRRRRRSRLPPFQLESYMQ